MNELNPKERSYCVYNKKLPLYTEKGPKGLMVYRRSDNTAIAHTIIKKWELVAGIYWDKISGKYLSIFFRDGSIRIIDVFKDGKLVAFLRTQFKNVDCTYWDRIEEQTTNEMKQFNKNIVDLMPSLIQFVSSANKLSLIPYTPSNANWRELDAKWKKNRVIDMHCLHQSETDSFLMVLNGDYYLTLKTPETDLSEKVPACSLIKSANSLYQCIYKDGSARKIDTSSFLSSKSCIDLLECILSLKDMSKYTRNHLDLLERVIIKPYLDFLEKICDGAFGREKLINELKITFLLGTISDELQDWLHYSVGDKNVTQWRTLCHDAYQQTTELFTIALMCACERMILLSERCFGLIMAFQFESGADDNSRLHELNELMSNLQDMLKSIIYTAEESANKFEMLKIFLSWLNDRVHEELDDDYKPQLSITQNSNTCYKLGKSFEYLLQEGKKDSEDILNFDIIKHTLEKIEANISRMNTKYIEPILENKIAIDTKIPFFKANYSPELTVTVRDIVKISQIPYVLYVVQLSSVTPTPINEVRVGTANIDGTSTNEKILPLSVVQMSNDIAVIKIIEEPSKKSKEYEIICSGAKEMITVYKTTLHIRDGRIEMALGPSN
ncbi:hypothetical protein KAFR_0B05460 [Kazachstania africana CBS 2517]|uniref:Anaphase-promoting complex subunit 4 n=1 Tax=Kazachstania africana (strain ATCC 22294 / BCRC 22015 / CBS 2517 / CECT 1963 / NBRC 1671 / NRRL Y-8276) TaxID=1071382 RepID=H2AR41_KAZAF|nr:hypothetical protein KAFR_0B05460 [Kazachstania africana CBS 2517]CCF56841.1 hypothetical protein KAFR_0B05460 [Kazachstania africana CBS 2517]